MGERPVDQPWATCSLLGRGLQEALIDGPTPGRRANTPKDGVETQERRGQNGQHISPVCPSAPMASLGLSSLHEESAGCGVFSGQELGPPPHPGYLLVSCCCYNKLITSTGWRRRADIYPLIVLEARCLKLSQQWGSISSGGSRDRSFFASSTSWCLWTLGLVAASPRWLR